MIAPARDRFGDIPVTPEEPLPIPLSIASGKAYRFCTASAYRETQAGCLVGDLVKGPGNGIEDLMKNQGKRMNDEL
jgi:hypothetical protein